MFEYPTPRAIAVHLLEVVMERGSVSSAVASHERCEAGQVGQALYLGGVISRWPGGCSLDVSVWEMLRGGGDAIGLVPAQRWVLEQMVDVDALSESQKACVQHGGFISGAERFDHRLFGVSRAEAAAMDPQQRLLLETGYEALHAHGGRLAWLLGDGGNVGVFVGIERPDWSTVQAAVPKLHNSVYAATGGTVSVASGRVSFVLGLQGPCMSVDTACSSALVSLHFGGHAVRGDECRSALASGVGLKLLPYATLGAAAAGMLSVDGRCKTLDARANGYVRSEGVGMVLLHSSTVGGSHLSLVSQLNGSSVRQDGRSASLTAPNGSAQRTLLQSALARASLPCTAVGCLEAHGTGTALGDPTEVGSMAAVYLASRRPMPLALGAAKANIGHAEAASGMMGLLRAQQVVRGAWSSGNAQLRALNPLIAARLQGAHSAVLAPLCAQSLKDGDVCGVSSFGFSGTIAHSVLSACVLDRLVSWSPLVKFRATSFPWRKLFGVKPSGESENAAFYSTCWQLAADSYVQRSAALDSVLVIEGQSVGGAGKAVVSALQAKIVAAGSTAAPGPLSRSWESVIVALDSADSMAPSLNGVKVLLGVVQQLARLTSKTPRLLLLTGGVQAPKASAGGLPLAAAAHGGAWGFARVVRLEQPSWSVMSIDVAADSCTSDAAASVVLAGGVLGGATECAWRGGERFEAMLRREQQVVDVRSAALSGGSYVITGGLGGLGLRAAVLLSSLNAHSLWLTSRSGRVARDGQGLAAQLAQLRRTDVVLNVIACDSSVASEVHALFSAASG
ncbi:MAG: beta-ketoacyl synthase N-terminal-like domain-containing protein, partial [Candidatus Limnocylindrus sp.]